MIKDSNKSYSITKTEGLSGQIVRGSVWVGILEISNQLLQFVKTFYAARILTPGDFGIVGFAFLTILLVDVFSTTGMKEAIIQSKNNLSSYLNTVWMIELGKGLVVLITCILISPWTGFFFKSQNHDLIRFVILSIGVIYFLQSITNIGVVFFEKNIQFSRFFIFQFSGTIVDVVISLVLVFKLRDISALFYGMMAGAFMKSLMSFLLVDFRPKFQFSYRKAVELFSYGKWIFKGRIVSFLGMQLDSLVVSTFLGLVSLGFYQMAFRIGNLPISQAANIMGKIIFPTFSKVHEDKLKLKEYFLSSLNILSVLFLPIIMLVYSFIPEFTTLFLGIKWIQIVPLVRILIISGYIRIFATILDYLFCAIGAPKISAQLQLKRTLSFIVAVIPLSYFWGIIGVALSGLIAILLVTIIYMRQAMIQLQINRWELADAILFPSVFGTIISILIIYLKGYFLQIDLMIFLILAFSLVFGYITIGLLINRFTQLKLFRRIILILQSHKLMT